jgi:hypothetical protein
MQATERRREEFSKKRSVTLNETSAVLCEAESLRDDLKSGEGLQNDNNRNGHNIGPTPTRPDDSRLVPMDYQLAALARRF